MTHLSTDELVDLAEGTRAPESAPHLATCDRCRQQVADLREMMQSAAGVPVPEPSPLFWDHLSSRVREAIADEPLPARRTLLDSWWMRAAAGVAVAAIVVAVSATFSSRDAGRPPAAVPQAVEAPAAPVASDDPSLALVTDLGGTLDWDDVREQIAVSAHPGGLDAAVGELDTGERRELERILKEEMTRPSGRSGRS